MRARLTDGGGDYDDDDDDVDGGGDTNGRSGTII